MYKLRFLRNLWVNLLRLNPLSIMTSGIISLGLLMALSPYAHSETAETSLEYGVIDWTRGVVRAKGLGVPPASVENETQARAMAKRAARIVAYERLLEITKGIKVDAQTNVENYILVSEAVKGEVKGIVKGAQVIEEISIPDGSVEVTLEMDLKFLDEIFDKIKPRETNPPEPKLPPKKSPEPSGQKEMNYTGLVINAKGLNFQKCMFPKILTDGQVIYSRDHVRPGLKGGAGYIMGIDDAKIHEKVTDNPLVIKALGVAKGSPTDLVINEADAQTIWLEPRNVEFLKEGKVVIAY